MPDNISMRDSVELPLTGDEYIGVQQRDRHLKALLTELLGGQYGRQIGAQKARSAAYPTASSLAWMYFNAAVAGAAGNDIGLTLVDPAANDALLEVVTEGTEITVNLATGPAGAITSTAAEVVEAINADPDAGALVQGYYNGLGSGVVAAVGRRSFTGGSDASAGHIGGLSQTDHFVYIKADADSVGRMINFPEFVHVDGEEARPARHYGVHLGSGGLWRIDASQFKNGDMLTIVGGAGSGGDTYISFGDDNSIGLSGDPNTWAKPCLNLGSAEATAIMLCKNDNGESWYVVGSTGTLVLTDYPTS